MRENIPFDIMEDYLQGVLSEKESTDFEKELAADQALRDEFDLYKQIRVAQANTGLTDFEKKLEKVEASFFDESTTLEKPPRSSSFNPFWLALLAIAAIIGAYFLNKNNASTPATKPQIENNQPIKFAELYNRFAKHDFAFQEMSSETDLSEIQNLLESKDYKNALPKMDAYLLNHPNAAEIKLAKGIALLESQNFEAATQSFTTLGEEQSLYKNEANWYLALTYLKQGDSEKALSFLEQIPESSSRYTVAQNLKTILR